MLKEGAVVALAGRTNAGKSSLFNRFLREERAIVSDAHGTTRDYLEADLDLGGIPVRLMDTAGLRDSVDPIEAEGVRRSLLLAEGADAILYVVDAAAGLTAEDEEFLRDRKDALRVWNKIDLPGARPSPPGWHAVSAKDGRGETGLASALRLALSGAGGPEHAAAPEGIVGARLSSAAQRDAVQRSVRALKDAELALEDGLPADAIALDIAEALDALGEVMGETTGEDVLDALFGNFCVGK